MLKAGITARAGSDNSEALSMIAQVIAVSHRAVPHRVADEAKNLGE
jgi:hypothetical protein